MGCVVHFPAPLTKIHSHEGVIRRSLKSTYEEVQMVQTEELRKTPLSASMKSEDVCISVDNEAYLI